ncbi:hypothetical protein COCOBI_03-7400 [Coccomyxa sp. Obi]|nr:hypothetical protein COCOBI_03-7400 [Coccomyxa sp. Obi]
MIDLDCYRGLRPGANLRRPAYDFTKYQQGEIESTNSGLDQDNDIHDANGTCDSHCAVTVGEQDTILQGVNANTWHKQMSDRSDVTKIADYEFGAASQPGTTFVTQLSRQQSCSEQPTRTTTRLDYFKRRRKNLLSKQCKLKMLQHDLYDTLVKLQALLSEDASLPLEDKAARLTCLVAEVCAIQLQAQEIHKAGRRSTNPNDDPLQPNHKHKHKPAAQHNTAKPKKDREAAQDECLDDSAGHGLAVARMGELIMQALQSLTGTHENSRRPATGAINSQQHSKGDTGSEHSKASEDVRPSRPHGKPTRMSQVPPAELQASWQRQVEQSRDIPAGSQTHSIGGPAGKIEEASSAGLADQPEATLELWHRCREEAGDRNSLSQLSSNEHAADKLHIGAQAHDGRCDRLLTMLQAELVLHGRHGIGGQEPSQFQLRSTPVNAHTHAFSGQADTRSYTTISGQLGCGSRLQQSGGAALPSRPPSVRAVQESAFSPQQPAHGRSSVRGPRQADWDSSISPVVDPDEVVKTQSGLRLRPPTRPAMAARPMSAYIWSNRPTIVATVVGSERPASRLGVDARSQKQGLQPWDEGSRGSRRPDWDDRFIVPEQQRQGRRQVEGTAPVHAFRASTPDRVLKENLPKRKQQHPWLSKRALQLHGQQPQPRSRRAASVPRPRPEGFGSLPSASAHFGTAAQPLGSRETPCPGPGSRDHLSSTVNARRKGPAKEMLDSSRQIWPNGAPVPALAQSAVHQEYPGLGLHDEAASQAHVEQFVGSQFGAASELRQQDEQGGSLCDRHLQERLEVNLQNSEVQKQSSDVESCAANAASGRLGAGSILGGAVSAEPLLAQLEDMEARMKAMMSTIESRLYGIQGA